MHYECIDPECFFFCHNIVFGWRIYWPWLVCVLWPAKPNYMWRSCKNYVYILHLYSIVVQRHYLFYIRYDSMSGLHYNIGLRHIITHYIYNVFVYAYDENLLFDRHSDRLNEIFFFGFVDKIKLSRLSTYRRSKKLYVFHFNVYPIYNYFFYISRQVDFRWLMRIRKVNEKKRDFCSQIWTIVTLIRSIN